MKIEYCHILPTHYNYGRTYAVQLIDKKTLQYAINSLAEVVNVDVRLNFGEAKLNKKDNYCKKTGREVAFKNMVPVDFSVQSVHVFKEKCRVIFKNKKHILELNFIADSDNVRLSFVQEN